MVNTKCSKESYSDFVNRVRGLPLAEVLSALCASKDEKAKNRWRFDDKSVWLGKDEFQNCFYDFSNKEGGRGAIDLVIYLKAVDFKGAISILSDIDSDIKSKSH